MMSVEEKKWIRKIKKDPTFLKEIEIQTDTICLKAVKQDGEALKYVKNQTEEICLAAVKQDGEALKYVKNQTEDICMEAVREYAWALEYAESQTEEIYLEAVKQIGHTLMYVQNQTEDICLGALFSGRLRFEFNYTYPHISSPTDEMQMIKSTVMKNGDLKSYRQIRSRLINQEIDLTNSPYHVLEQLYSY